MLRFVRVLQLANIRAMLGIVWYLGTPFYLSPEICEGKKYAKKSDVWSLGCILYELTTLKRAFNGRNLPALVLKILRGTYPPIPSQYSKDLQSLIDRMLQQDPAQRPSISQVRYLAPKD